MNIGVKTGRAWKDWEGQIVDGEFRLLKCLHASERGAVFRTERPGGEPHNAVIKLRAQDDVTAAAQLARWKSSALLVHPHLMRLFEMGRANLSDLSCTYVVMEYAEEELAQIDRPLTVAEASDMLSAALKVLAFLHAKRFAHGHLKTTNVMAVNDQIKFSSDTIRPIGEWRSDLDVQVPSDPPEIVHRGAASAGDVWSLGITLVNALTTQSPSWEAGAIAASLRDSLPAVFRVMVAGCLRRDPEKRWTIPDLEEFLQSNVEAPPPPAQPSLIQPAPLSPAQHTSPQPAVLHPKLTQPALPQHTSPQPTSTQPAVSEQRRPKPPNPQIKLPKYAPPPRKNAPMQYVLLAGAIGLIIAAFAIVPRLIDHRAVQDTPVTAPVRSQNEPVIRPSQPNDAFSKTAVPGPPPRVERQEIQEQVIPDVPAQARNTIRGHLVVRLRVSVDSNGSVIAVKNETPGSSRYFVNLATQAARQWKFAPAGPGGDPTSREWTLRFQFIKDPNNAVSVQATPARQ
jgi:TonB family protein